LVLGYGRGYPVNDADAWLRQQGLPIRGRSELEMTWATVMWYENLASPAEKEVFAAWIRLRILAGLPVVPINREFVERE
jgi:hypothetical protein